jgi:cytochrome c-type biogenesis protein CcmH
MAALPSVRRTSPSPLVGEGRVGGDGRTSAVGCPPTPNPSPPGGGERVGARGGRKLQRHPGEGRDPVHFAATVWVIAHLMVLCILGPAAAVQPDEVLKDPALEARARSISQELRCLVCQNQSIDDSNAELARDLRVIVRERLSAGDSDAQVLAFVEKRYGEFVLLRPRLAPHTLILWLTPLLLLAGVAAAIYRRARTHNSAADVAPLSPAEQQRLDELTDKRS